MKNTKTKTGLKIAAIALVLLLGGGLAFLVTRQDQAAETEVIENAGTAVHADLEPTELTYNSETIQLKAHLETILLLGTDNADLAPVYDDPDLAPFYNYNQADVLILLIIDHDAQTVTPILLNRDTMWDIPWLDVTGRQAGTVYEQLALAYNYGSGSHDSCKNTRNAVESLLFSLPIDHYIAFTMSGITTLNDLVGGVTVTIDEDLTAADPLFVEGTTITLQGEHAENFIRARSSVSDGTNVSRMGRHKQYLAAFLPQARKAYNSDSVFMTRALEKLSDYLLSDMTANQLSQAAEALDKYTIADIQTEPGDNVLGEEYYEFYPDLDGLWAMLKQAVAA